MRAGPTNKNRFRFESLEPRQMMAGNVSASMSGGDLVVSGDAYGNGIEVRRLDVQKYQVRGFNQAGANTAVNGYQWQVFGDVFGSIVVRSGGGNDYVWIGGNSNTDPFKTGESVFVQTGSGADTIVVMNATIGRNLHIETGAGKDSTYVYNVWALREMQVAANYDTSDPYGDYIAIYGNSRVGYAGYEGLLIVSGSYGSDTLFIDRVTTHYLYAVMHDGADKVSLKNTRVLTDAEFHGGSGFSDFDVLNVYNNSGRKARHSYFERIGSSANG